MMARANPEFALRPFLPDDAPLLADIFRASIEELTGEDYSEAQQQAWAAAAEDAGGFAARLAAQLTIVATLDGSPVGFASLARNEEIDMLYVHPAVAGRGVGTMLCTRWKSSRARAARRGSPRRRATPRDCSSSGAPMSRSSATRFTRRRMDRQHHHAEAARRAGCAIKRPDTPFPRHWLYYVAIKLAVIAIAVALGLKLVGYW